MYDSKSHKILKTGLFSTSKSSSYHKSNHLIKKIVSGGQTGVDRAALNLAIELQIPFGGWCPHGRLAEDGKIPADYNLEEARAPTPTEMKDDNEAIYKIRTELNVRDSDGTLIITTSPPIGGTLYTIKMAENHEKPYLIFNWSNEKDIEDIKYDKLERIKNWIIQHNIQTLNVAGPRASQVPGIVQFTRAVLSVLLTHPLFAPNKTTQLSEAQAENSFNPRRKF